jgi:short-subunit dehydrogenase
MPSVMIMGATSSIARAIAQEFASHRYRLVLVGRDEPELSSIGSDLRIRFAATVSTFSLDVIDFDTQDEALRDSVEQQLESIDGVIVCAGYLGDQDLAQVDLAESQRILQTNFTACVSLLNLVANQFEGKRSGFICALGSVAGDRGRQSNYLYGAAKGGLAIYLEGLRNRLSRSQVQVITVKPGFVDTAMTFGKSGLFLVTSPERVARAVYRAIASGRNTVYVPWFWRPMMLLIRSIPESIFKHTRT